MRKNQINYKKIFIILSILALGYVSYSPSLDNDFVNWDDDKYILENPDITSLNNFKKFFSSYYVGNYQPLSILSYAIEYNFFKFNPRPYHKTNLFFHLFNTILLFYIFYFLSGKYNISIIISIAFLIHPMHVESVVWISERKDVLYTFFYFLSVLSYLIFIKSRKLLYFLISVLLFVLSLFSKSAAITLPLILFLIDYFLRRKYRYKVLFEKLPYIVLSILFGVIAIYSQADAKAIISLPDFSFFDRFFLVSYAVLHYFTSFLVPYNLSILYFYPDSLSSIYYISPVIFVLIIFLLIKIKKYRHDLLFGFLFFFLTISIVLQIIPVGNALTADRYTYIPYIGLFYIVAFLISELINKFPRIKYFILVFLFGYSLFFIIKTRNQIKVWENGEVLFSKMISDNPKKTLGYVNRGIARYYGYNSSKIPDYPLAIQDFNDALKINDREINAYFNRGNCYYQLNQHKSALQDFSQTIELDSDYYKAYNNKGLVLSVLYKDSAAIDSYNRAIKINPDYSDAYLNRGISYYNLNQLNQACKDWYHAKKLINQRACELISKFCN
ncbi:MAG: tetratricopeptide repeat protein [Bacteroidota bacterium]